MLSLFVIGLVALESKIQKCLQCFAFAILLKSPFPKGRGPSFESRPINPIMLCAKVGSNWHSCSGKDNF